MDTRLIASASRSCTEEEKKEGDEEVGDRFTPGLVYAAGSLDTDSGVHRNLDWNSRPSSKSLYRPVSEFIFLSELRPLLRLYHRHEQPQT